MRLKDAATKASYAEQLEPGLRAERLERSEVFVLKEGGAVKVGLRLEEAGLKQRVIYPVSVAEGAEVSADEVAGLIKSAVNLCKRERIRRLECQVPPELAGLMSVGLEAAGFLDEGVLHHFEAPISAFAEEDAGTPFFWRTMVEVGPNVAMAMLERVSEEDPHGTEEKGLNPEEELEILLDDSLWVACRNSVQIGYYDGDAGSFVACLVDRHTTTARIGYMGLTWRNRNRKLCHWLLERAGVIAHEENATKVQSAAFADQPKVISVHKSMGFTEIGSVNFWEWRP